MLKNIETREDGFTLIELLIVIVIIGILAAIAIPVFLSQAQNARNASVQSDVRNAATQVAQVAALNGAPSDTDGQAAVKAVSANNTVTYKKGTGNSYTITGVNSDDDKYAVQFSSDTGKSLKGATVDGTTAGAFTAAATQ